MTENAGPARGLRTYAWWLVLCLVGLDYFSTLAYLPSLAIEAGSSLAPLAALGVAAVTLLLALPVYAYVVGRSPHGEGATGLLERHVHGWLGKVLILVLLGFVATDYVITRSLSVADATRHLLENPYWKAHVEWLTQNKETVRQSFPEALRGSFFDFWSEQLVVTVVLTVLAFGAYTFIFRGLNKGFLVLAAAVVVAYLTLTGIVVGSGLMHLARHPELLADWANLVREEAPNPDAGAAGVFGLLALWALLAFPQMALGVSGFELSLASAPLVRGRPDDDPERPRGRVRNTRKLLLAAALVMGVFLVGSVLVVERLVAPETAAAGAARHRALAYLAHGGGLRDGQPASALNPLFGPPFGTLYDLSAVLILCLAGASVAVGLRDVVPQFLARYGMQLEWARKVGVIVHLFNVVILVMTLVFRASVSAQQWAYATSVLVLLTSAALAVLLDLRSRWGGSRWRPVVLLPFFLISTFFLVMAGLTLVKNRSGLYIALLFVGVVLVTGFLSRWLRSTELRFHGFTFADEYSRSRWKEICGLEFQVLVPHRPDHHTLAEKDRQIRARHRLGPDVPIIFVEAQVGDPSDFYHMPLMEVVQANGVEVIRVSRCASVAHVLAAIGLEFRQVGRPPEIHFGWSDESPLAANLHFLFWGEGNIPWLVHDLIRKAERDPARRPRVVVG